MTKALEQAKIDLEIVEMKLKSWKLTDAECVNLMNRKSRLLRIIRNLEVKG